MKKRFLSILLSLILLLSFGVANVSAASVVSSLTFNNVHEYFAVGESPANYNPGTISSSSAYQRFWCIEKIDANGNFAGVYFPSDMTSLAYEFYASVSSQNTSAVVNNMRNLFGTTFEAGYKYYIINAAKVINGSTFFTSVNVNINWSTGIKETVTVNDTYGKLFSMVYAPLTQLGDCNNDGVINSNDALITLQCAVQKISFNSTQATIADVDKTSGVTSSDALIILQYAVKKIKKF